MNVHEEQRLMAAVDMLRRCGAREVQVRFQDDEQPVVWNVVGRFVLTTQGAVEAWEVGAGFSPWGAAEALLERVIDGGRCVHCGKPAGFTTEWGDQPLADAVCWTKWDPELATYRRSCP